MNAVPFTRDSGYAGYGTPPPPTRTFADHLPRRSLLLEDVTMSLSTDAEAEADAAAAAAGRHTLDPFAAVESPSMRHMRQLRPVASPQTATAEPTSGHLPLPVIVPTTDSSRPSAATSTRNNERNARADSGFSLTRVRLQDAWHTDMWLYMCVRRSSIRYGLVCE